MSEGDGFDIEFTTSSAMGRGTTPSAEMADPEGGGLRLGRYTTVRLLGKGGMAEVYLARQDGPAGFEKTCVVKRMRRALAEEKRFVDMFLREARVAARLNHNNVVQIFELGQQDDEYFIAMEYLDGISLHRAARRCWANETSMPMEVVLRAVADAAKGLHHAHTLRSDQGQPTPLVHRDISPDNLVVTRDGVTKVLDFGIAKSGNEADEVTRTGELKGKIPYMSPEQIRGEPLDGRSDLWALGVTLYWLLTGKRPFDGGSDHMTIDRILRHEPQAPRELNPLIPANLQTIIFSLLDKDVERRLATGLELNDRLVGLLGPSSGAGPASSFCNQVMEMAPLEQNITPGSVLTIIAARPETQWLKRVSSEEGEAAGDLASMVPEATGMVAVKRREPEPGEPDTGETVSGLYTQSLLPGAGARSKKVLPMAAAVVAAAAMALVGAVVVLGHDDDAPLPEAPPDAVVDKAASPASSDPSPAEMASPSPPEGKAAPGEATNDEDEQADAPPDPEADESSRPPKRAERGASRSRSAPGLAIQTRGPSSVVWKVGRKKLGKGNGTVKAPAGTSVLVALDTSTGGLTQVPVKNGAADYASVGKGTLSLRIKPWAKASIGGRTLGTTPLDPVSLPAGRYQVKLVWNDVVKTETVTVQAGRTAVVKADMRK